MGNISWGYFNMGTMVRYKWNTERQEMHNQDMYQIMKRHPAAILGFGNVGPHIASMLRLPGVPGMSKDELLANGYDPEHHLKRPAFEYLTIRGEQGSINNLGLYGNQVGNCVHV